MNNKVKFLAGMAVALVAATVFLFCPFYRATSSDGVGDRERFEAIFQLKVAANRWRAIHGPSSRPSLTQLAQLAGPAVIVEGSIVIDPYFRRRFQMIQGAGGNASLGMDHVPIHYCEAIMLGNAMARYRIHDKEVSSWFSGLSINGTRFDLSTLADKALRDQFQANISKCVQGEPREGWQNLYFARWTMNVDHGQRFHYYFCATNARSAICHSLKK